MKCKKAVSFQNVYFSYEKKLLSILRLFNKKNIINYNLKDLNFEIVQGDYVGLLVKWIWKKYNFKTCIKNLRTTSGTVNLFDKNSKAFLN